MLSLESTRQKTDESGIGQAMLQLQRNSGKLDVLMAGPAPGSPLAQADSQAAAKDSEASPAASRQASSGSFHEFWNDDEFSELGEHSILSANTSMMLSPTRPAKSEVQTAGSPSAVSRVLVPPSSVSEPMIR